MKGWVASLRCMLDRTMRPAPSLFATVVLTALPMFAQTPQPKPELLLFHPPAPLSYDVATIKPIDPSTAAGMIRLPPGMTVSPLSVRRYIMDAYAAVYPAQVIGGPDWLEKDAYNIKGKPSGEIEAAQQTMTTQDRSNQERSMKQSLLAERFHLKAHFESRVLPVYELVPAKVGLKITEVPAPPERKPGDFPIRMRPGDALPPGSMMTMMNSTGLRVINGHAVKMDSLARTISFSGATELADRPIVNHTGFSGYFDIKDLTWAPLGDASATNAPDAPSLSGALEQTLGIKLFPAKDPIEVLVIDSIDRPSPD